MKSFKQFCGQRDSFYRKLNEAGPAPAPGAPAPAPAAGGAAPAPAPGQPAAGQPAAGQPAQPPASKTLPLVQKGMSDMQAAMQKNPADPNLAKMATDLQKNLQAWQQELAQAAKAPAAPAPGAAPGAPAPGGQPAAPGAPAPAAH